MKEADCEEIGYIKLTRDNPFTFFRKQPNKNQIDGVIKFWTHHDAWYALKVFMNNLKKFDEI